jgi:GT2 family glycosyltransferase
MLNCNYIMRCSIVAEWAVIVSSIIRRSVFQAWGGFDESVFVEDYELWLCAAYSGYKFPYIPRIICEIRKHVGSRSHGGPQEEIRNVLASIQTPRLKTLMGAAYQRLQDNWQARLQSAAFERSVLQRLGTVVKSL